MQIVNRLILAILLTVGAHYVNAQFYRVHTGEGHKNSEITIYDSGYVDVVPQFPGGERALMKFINETRRYPQEAYNNKVQGRVVCSFVVYPDGTINGISVIKGVEDALDREAVRIIREMPRWMAGQINNQAVPVSCVLAIPFRL